jgi:predicted transcriptional regulator
MTAIELKKELIHRIAEIDDVSFLNAIRTILDTKTQSRSIVLSSAQHDEIEESRKDIEQGLFVELAELDKEFDKWLSER